MSLLIREAVRGDEQLVFAYICSLADYESLRHEVSASAADIGESLFGPTPRAHCDLAFWQGKPAGFALWFYNYSTFRGLRGLGIGKALLKHLAQRCVAEGLPRLQWWVLDWNTPSIEFYKSLGAVPQDEWTVFRVSGEALDKLAAQ